jgi:leucyl aminopeptidase (aminopeptidase T)
LNRGIATLLHQLALEPSDRLLVMTDTKSDVDVGRAIVEGAQEIGADAVWAHVRPREMNGADPPPQVVAAFAASDVVVFVNSWSPTHSASVISAMHSGLRVLSMPGVRMDMLDVGGMTADYDAVQALTVAWGERFARGGQIRLTTALGTDIVAELGGLDRRPLIDGGTLPRGRGGLGNMPAGEVAICPVEGTTQGRLVAELTVSTTKRPLARPIEFEIRDGVVVSVRGDQEARDFEAALNLHGPSAKVVAEVALGTNAAARHIGIVIEDEKMCGTAHLGFGNAIGFGGKNRSGIHIDAIFGAVTCTLDGQTLLEGGNIVSASLQPCSLESITPLEGRINPTDRQTRVLDGRLFVEWDDVHGTAYWAQVGDPATAKAAADLLASQGWADRLYDPRLAGLLHSYGLVRRSPS